MPELFTRYLNIAAEAMITSTTVSGNEVLKISNKDGKGLRMQWDIQRSNTSSTDSGTVTIYNIGKDAVSALNIAARWVKNITYKMTFSFGWDGKVGQCITCPITEIQPEIVTENDVLTQFIFAEKSNQNEIPSEILSASAVLYLSAFRVIADKLNVKLSKQFIDAVNAHPIATSAQTLSAVFGNDPIQDMNAMISGMGPNYTWTIQSGFIFLLNNGLFQDNTPPQIIRPSSGLLTFTPQEGGGVQAQCLANPGILPGQQIIFQDKNNKVLGGGPLRVESVRWSGDTDSVSVMDIIARDINVIVVT